MFKWSWIKVSPKNYNLLNYMIGFIVEYAKMIEDYNILLTCKYRFFFFL